MAFATAFDQSSRREPPRIHDGRSRRPLRVQFPRTMTAFALDSRAQSRKIRPTSYARGVAMEAAIDGLGALRLAERGGGAPRSLRAMTDREARPALSRIPGNAVLEITAIDPSYWCDTLGARAECPFERRRGPLAALVRGHRNAAWHGRIVECESALFPNYVADELFRERALQD